MKKVIIVVGISALFLSGCVVTGGNIQGMIITDVQGAGNIHLAVASGNMVEGRATASGILGFVSGDCSYGAALKDAMSKTGGKAIKNIVVDYKVKNILNVYAVYTTIVQGEPVQ